MVDGVTYNLIVFKVVKVSCEGLTWNIFLGLEHVVQGSNVWIYNPEIVGLSRPKLYYFSEDDLRFYSPSVVLQASGSWKSDKEKLSEMKLCLLLKQFCRHRIQSQTAILVDQLFMPPP